MNVKSVALLFVTLSSPAWASYTVTGSGSASGEPTQGGCIADASDRARQSLWQQVAAQQAQGHTCGNIGAPGSSSVSGGGPEGYSCTMSYSTACN